MDAGLAGRPIGVLDSGVGGLSVLRQLRLLLPAEGALYGADSAWCPYGRRPAAEVRARAHAVTAALVGRGAKLVVVACNSASAVALADLRRASPRIPIVGMEPAVKPAVARTRTGRVGVLATATTAGGDALARLIGRYGEGRGVCVHVAVPEGLVELVERGEGDSPAAESAVAPIVRRWREAGVDVIALGCTHFPFARRAIARVAGPGVALIDPAPAVARQAARLLAAGGGLAPAGAECPPLFLTSGSGPALARAVERLLPPGARWPAPVRVEALGA